MWDRVGTDGKRVLPVLNIKTIGCQVAYPPIVWNFHFLYFEIKMWQPVFTTALNKYVCFPVLERMQFIYVIYFFFLIYRTEV